MKYGKFEIKNYKYYAAMSQDTSAFSLDLYYEGKLCAHVKNEGKGGCHSVYPATPFTSRDLEKIEAELAADEFLVDPGQSFERADAAIDTLCSMIEAEKLLKKNSKIKCMFISEDNEIRALGIRTRK